MPRAVSRKNFFTLGGVGLAGAALLGVAGCGGSLGSNKKIVGFFTGAEETTTQERAVTEIQVDRFKQQHPKYALEREPIQTDEVREVIQARLRSKKPPDVFTYDTGPAFGGVLTNARFLYPLEKAYKQNGWNIYGWAKQRATYDGTLYGVPDRVQEIIVYFNKDLVSEEPKTVDNLRQIADELKGQGKIPFAFGDLEQWPAGHLFSMGVSNVLGREGLDNILYGDGGWGTPEVERAIDLFFKDFVESGYYPEGVNAITRRGQRSVLYWRSRHEPHRHLARLGDRPGCTGLRGRVLPVPVHRRLRHLASSRAGDGSVRG
jgi:raffinose/stachyose/melibiose transport system substrate-binding protein